MAPHLDSTWEEYIQHAKFWRNEVKRSLGESISRLEVVSDLDGNPAVLGLAAAPGDSASCQMLMQAGLQFDEIPLRSDELMEERPILELKPFHGSMSQLLQRPQSAGDDQLQMVKPPPELALHYERLRGQMSAGVSEYERHPETGAILLSTATQLFVYKNHQSTQIAQWLSPQASFLNASFSKITSDYVAFNSGNQLYIDRNGVQVFKSNNSLPNTTNGVASFIAQEEFERYEGYWWSPTRVEILYERVDETPVGELSFSLPGAAVGEELPMRYPYAGGRNAISTPRICRMELDENGEERFVDLDLDADLLAVVPWMEYFVRMGWTSAGEEVFVLVMNRPQTHLAILLIPRTLFVDDRDAGKGVGNVKIIYEESSPIWLNANNHLHFLPTDSNASEEKEQQSVQFIVGSEKSDKCHLYLETWDEKNGSTSSQITFSEQWPVLKEAVPKVDLKRGLIFFLAERVSPVILSLCVSSLPCTNSTATVCDCKVLTPKKLSYRFERCDPTLCLNPDVGFVCWLSAVDTLPECRFYRLVYGEENGALPDAVFTHRIGVQIVSPSQSIGSSTASWGLPYLHRPPASLFSHKFCEYQSKESGERHFALALWPAPTGDGLKIGMTGIEEVKQTVQKFPVIHSVYAGPSIQLVRNSWQTISPYLKFLAFGYAIVLTDGRGSANRGLKFESHIKGRMGSVELVDQVEGLRQAAEQTDGVFDLERVVAIGWSYGGYMSLQLLAEYPDIYKACAAGGAVTDWQLYDTAYTERYMGTPQENAEAYKLSSVLNKVDKLPNQDERLLLVHGMIDENVHFQHIVRLINALVKAQKPYQLVVFPSERHAIRNGESTEYFHASVLAFFGRALSRVGGGKGRGENNENNNGSDEKKLEDE